MKLTPGENDLNSNTPIVVYCGGGSRASLAGKTLKEIGDYIKSTYGQHYSIGKDGFQVQDLFKTLKIGKDFCHANAIKYLCRYGKKNGHNRADLLKAVHYVILLLNYDKELK